jgi:hypothetical protein
MHLIWTTQLWEVMLLHSSEFLVRQCTKSEFIDTLEDVLTSQHTSPVVRKRLLGVLLLAAAINSGTPYESSFRVLLGKMKPAGISDEVGPYLLYAVPFAC